MDMEQASKHVREHARRLKACENACKGVSTEALEQVTLTDIKDLVWELQDWLSWVADDLDENAQELRGRAKDLLKTFEVTPETVNAPSNKPKQIE